jgi:hypothetical protein
MTDQVETRQVVLAYPREIEGKNYAPDETVTLPAEGKEGAIELVRTGRARWPEGTEQGVKPGSKGAARGPRNDTPKEA